LFLLRTTVAVIVVITVFNALFLNYCTFNLNLFSYSAIQPQVCNKLSVQFGIRPVFEKTWSATPKKRKKSCFLDSEKNV